MIKLFQPFGKIVRVQFPFHMVGDNRGAPRGFCFIEFSLQEVSLVPIYFNLFQHHSNQLIEAIFITVNRRLLALKPS